MVGTTKELGVRRMKDSNVVVGNALRVCSADNHPVNSPLPTFPWSTATRISDQAEFGCYASGYTTHHRRSGNLRLFVDESSE